MSRGDWAARRERGSRVLLRLMIRISLGLGRPAGDALLTPITAWFVLASPAARAASREFLGRVLGRPARTREVWRHFRAFAAAILDRVFLLAGRTQGFDIRVSGLVLLEGALAGGRGAILLGAHLGSFEVLRVFGRTAPVAVRALMFRANAGALTSLLAELDPALAAAVIEIGAPGAMLEVRDSLGRGEMVGILADRSPGAGRMVAVPFLGAAARFPAGPFILAGVLDAPVLLFWGIRTGPRRYEIRFERFADRIRLERRSRQADLSRVVGLYAERLADMACRHPYNWFNFFRFWEVSSDGTGSAPALAVGSSARPGNDIGGGAAGLGPGN